MLHQAKKPVAVAARRAALIPGARSTHLRATLLTSSLLTSFATPALADSGPRALTPAWFASRAGATAAAAPSITPQASVAAVQQSLANLRQAASTVATFQLGQATARTAAAALHFGGNGLGAGALQPVNVTAWQNATAPTQAAVQTPAGARTQVTVTQTAQKAILTWSSFNVGAATDLVFDQSAGGKAANTWVALNRVTDPAAQPSQILGTIRAPGQVYVINRNGILFGGGSQVNVGSLIASTADFNGGNKGFLANGVYSAQGTNGLLPAFGGAADSDAPAGSAVTVQAGAQIVTAAPASVQNRGGTVTLLGGTVQNAGSISAPQGQIVLAAGQRFVVTQGYSNSGSGDPLATTLGNQVAVTGGGSATNTGLLRANVGDITLVGHAVTQGGVAMSTTTTSVRGTIHLLTDTSDLSASVTLAPGSLTSIVPDTADTGTALNAQRTTLIATSAINNAARLTAVAALNNTGNLADQLDQSRIEVTTGGVVSFASGSLTLANAGQIAVSAGRGRVSAASGAQLDVSGLTTVTLPVSSNILTINVQPTELRDSPANRDAGTLAGKNFYVDARNLTLVPASAAATSDRLYTPGGLIEVSGYVAGVGHTIAEWSTVGGTVTLAGGQVVLQPRSGVNLAGGAIAYQGGLVNTSYVTGSDGQTYSVANAPGTLRFTGPYVGFTVTDAKYNISETFTSPLVAPAQTYQAGYVVGKDAGSLILSTPSAIIGATITAGVTTGRLQTAARPAAVADPFTLAQTVAPLGGALALGNYGANGLAGVFATDVTLGGAAIIDAVPDPLTGADIRTALLSGSLVNASGLATLQVATSGRLNVTGPLALTPGGQVSLTAPGVVIAGNVTAPDATITISNRLSADGTYLTTAGAAQVTVQPGARIAATGLWNNRLQAPADATGAAFVNGGSVSIISSQGITLGAGSAIDVSSGGTLTATGAFTGGKGGNVTLLANDPLAGVYAAPLVIGGSLKGYGVNGGGTLSITAPQVRITANASGVTGDPKNILDLTPGVFQAGFSAYVINGQNGLTVSANTALPVFAPVYQRNVNSAGLPTGAASSAAFDVGLQPVFTPNLVKASVTQRPGASLTLQSIDALAGGGVTIGAGSAISVDPGQSVNVQAYNSLFVDGTITARGGTINLVNTRYQDGTDNQRPSLYAQGLAIWLGATSRLDASGIAQTAMDLQQRPFGTVLAGGTITIGGLGGLAGDATLKTTDAQIIVRPGAVLDASGTTASIDPAAGRSTVLAASAGGGAVADPTAGGTINLSSYTGIFIDGQIRAKAGGTGAAGGTLALSLETPVYEFSKFSPAASLLVPRVLTVTTAAAPVLPTTLTEGQATSQAVFGRATLATSQVAAGGFGTVALSSRGLILFDGNVALRTAQAVTLANGILADSAPGGRVSISAPYVRIGGDTSVPLSGTDTSPLITQSWVAPVKAASATLSVTADVLDVVNDVRLGTGSKIPLNGSLTASTTYAGFSNVFLGSTGDIRFLAAANSVSNRTTLISDGAITLAAAQLYPVGGAVATVVAGYNYAAPVTANPLKPNVKLTVQRSTPVTPDAPLSVGGSLTLAAGEVDQGGVVRAPLGSLTLGAQTTAAGLVGFGNAPAVATTRVVLLPGSITSVSAAGLTLPFGGTSDGVNYSYNGGGASIFSATINLAGRSVLSAAGSLLDLGGGGTLTGGGGELRNTGGAGLVSQGFIAGRGGSADTLVTPLLQFTAGSTATPTATLASNPVYAIVPGYSSGYAPVTPIDGSANYYGSQPLTGQQVAIAAGVPGLAAGTYTLLPSYYALLPGAFRVELTSTRFTAPAAGAQAFAYGYGNYQVAARTATAQTAVQSSLPLTAIVTPGATVRTYSQYDEQSYAAFQVAQAATFDRIRPLLPQDAGTLVLSYAPIPIRNQALTFDGLANLAAGAGGYGGTVSVIAGLKSGIEITGPAGATTTKTVAVSAAALNQIGASRLVIGGLVTYAPGSAGSASLPAVSLTASAGSTTVDGGAVLSAPEVFLLASSALSTGAVTLAPGAVIDLIGRAAPAYDSAGTGLLYDVQRNTALLASNGQITLAPTNFTQRNSSGPLSIGNGSATVAEGSIVTSTEATVSIGAGAVLGASSLTLAVPVVNIGTAAPNVPVPDGLALTSAVLKRLLAGDPATLAPALRSLQVTASAAVNFYGTVDFSAGSGSGLQSLVLNTPAIHGQGGSGDVARIAVDTFVWNGVASAGAIPASVLPQGVVAGGAGNGTGALSIETQRLVFGYADGVAPPQRVSLDREIVGFSQVRLAATRDIEFNSTGTLSVFAQKTAAGGTGGLLTLAAPVITGASGGSLSLTAGGAIALTTIDGKAATAVQRGQGATLLVSAPQVEVATRLALNAGRIGLTATAGDVLLDPAARLDTSGVSIALFDVTVGTAGGIVTLESRTGNVVQAAGSVIDVSATDADAGALSVLAPGGAVALSGTLSGGAADGFAGGSFTTQAGTLGDFAALNTILDKGGFNRLRHLSVATGDITIGQTIRAQDVLISADGGSLTAAGTIDASGATPGTIALSARDGLLLTGAAVLDAHATVAQTDSTGAAIASANRADVSLTANAGALTLQGGATIDVRNASGTDYGTIALYAPRTGSAVVNKTTVQNDIAVDASAPLTIRGASSLALYGVRSYTPADATVTQSALASADTDSVAIIGAALANTGLRTRIAGLDTLAAFHLRPAVAYVSPGALTVSGDLDLNGLRYTSLSGAPKIEPGALLLRAGGTLNVFGSISDGFAAPVKAAKPNPDDNGWILLKGVEPTGQSVVVPQSVTLAAGTGFATNTGAVLNYDVPLSQSTVSANTVIPVATTVLGPHKVPAGGFVTTASITSGTVTYPAGTLLPAGTRLSNFTVGAGTILPFKAPLMSGTIWPAGTSFAGFVAGLVKVSADVVVPAGGLIPAGARLVLPGNAASVTLRPTNANNTQGSVVALGALDTSGQSWSIALVGGANLASANTRAVSAPGLLAAGTGNILLADPHYVNPGNLRAVQPGLSVIRTGTGDLSLQAAGNVTEASLFGIYTAGVQSANVDPAFTLPLGTGFSTNGNVLSSVGTNGFNYNATLSAYRANYPTGGGNVSVTAQNDVIGDVVIVRNNGAQIYQSDAVGNWLWRQGGSAGQPAAYWINFGSYTDSTNGSNTLELVGFSGIGTLGGGNVSVSAGRNAGNQAVNGSSLYTATALDVVAASTGRLAGSTVVQTGGGNVSVTVAGTINDANNSFSNNGLGSTLTGVIGSTRGAVSIAAGTLGHTSPTAALIASGPLVAPVADAFGGPLLLLGDSSAHVTSRADLVLGGVIDPGRVLTANTVPWTGIIGGVSTNETGGGRASFSLWTPTTSVSIASAGGTVVPTLDVVGNLVGNDTNILYPGTLNVVAATGNIVYASVQGSVATAGPALELAPSPVGQLQLLAGGGINAAGLSPRQALGLDISGAPNGPQDLPSLFRPAFQGTYEPSPGAQFTVNNVTDTLALAGYTSLFAFTADTPTSVLHAADVQPARIYAAGGDIVDLNFGETWRFVSGSNTIATWYLAAKPALIQASRDIINAGTSSLLPVNAAFDTAGLKVTRNLVLNTPNSDLSVVSAGRDIFYGNFGVAGPGTLEVAAGRNLYQADQGSLFSLGQVVGTNTSQSGGAGILLLAGLAQDTPDWAGLQALYLGTVTTNAAGQSVYTAPSVAGLAQVRVTYQAAGAATSTVLATAPTTISTTVQRNPAPAGQASSCVLGVIVCDNHSIPGTTPLTTVAQGYNDALVAYLTAKGFTPPPGAAPDLVRATALAQFQAMPLYQRIPFLMQTYYSELGAGGLEKTSSLLATDARYTATTTQRNNTFARGREANAAIEPNPIVASPATLTNGITLFGGSGVSTAFGGTIAAFAPGGRLVLGLASLTPPTPATGQPPAGLITFGSGDIDISTYGSVLLGTSRTFTTFGGAINIWSEGGDINAGTGSKTTSVYQPPRISYDSTGTITLSPTAPTSGAGIATLAPVAGVPAGDVVLTVEQGIVDSGEAGIRSSGRIISNVVITGTGGATAAGGVAAGAPAAAPAAAAPPGAGGASAAAASVRPEESDARRKKQEVPAIITVEVVSFGGETFQ